MRSAAVLLQPLAHMAWADATVWREVLDRSGVGDDARVTELLYHIHSVQCVYLQLLQGKEFELPDLSSFDSRRSLMNWGRDCQERLLSYAEKLDIADLERELTIPWADQLVARVRDADVGQSLLQVSFHSAYHRGQVNTRIRELGGEPPLVDFIVWVWSGQPEAEWP